MAHSRLSAWPQLLQVTLRACTASAITTDPSCVLLPQEIQEIVGFPEYFEEEARYAVAPASETTPQG